MREIQKTQKVNVSKRIINITVYEFISTLANPFTNQVKFKSMVRSVLTDSQLGEVVHWTLKFPNLNRIQKPEGIDVLWQRKMFSKFSRNVTLRKN